MFVSKNTKICFIPNANAKICITANAKPQHESVEYRLRWASGIVARVGHVHFMLFVSILFALGSQREGSFQWNMGFKVKITVEAPCHIGSC